jgi:sarcosine oxidase subunit beta
MSTNADVIVVGAGIQGASLAFHLARRGAAVVVLDRSTAASGATGRSSGFVRMHYDLRSEAALAWASFPYFTEWADRVGEGDPGFVRTGFVRLLHRRYEPELRANVAMQQQLGIDTRLVGTAELAELCPGIVTEDLDVAAYEPRSGYADPTSATAGFLGAAKRLGARLFQGHRVDRVIVEGSAVAGVDTDRGEFRAPIVVDAAGAWAAQLAATVGLEVPIEPWRHDTAFFGLPDGRTADFPVVVDDPSGIYFRPEGRELMLVGLEEGNVVGGSPDRPLTGIRPGSDEEMITRVCGRLPWMAAGTFRSAHGGQDGITPDQRAIIGPAGPDGFYLDCGFSGTGFKTAPAIGAALSELILDGRTTTADLSDFTLDRYAEGRELRGEHPYALTWR